MELLKMKRVNVIILLILLPFTTFSMDDGNISQTLSVAAAYYFPDNQGVDLVGDFAPISYSPIEASDSTKRDLGSSWGGAELMATYKLSITEDFLQGESPLTSDNSIKYSFRGGLSPVSFEIGGDITVTPIAFLDFNIGSTIASGWTAIGIVGLGLNEESGVIEDSFQGLLSQSWLTGTFKFDTAVLMSGDTTWKHVIILSSHKLLFRYFSAAEEDDPWSFQGSEGDNYNGFTYSTTTVVAYQMPIVLEMAGVLVETEANMFDNSTRSIMSDGGWGSDFIQVRFGGIFNFKISENQGLAILPQFITRPHYTDDTVDESYFANRVIDTDNPVYIDFDRIALSYSYNF